MKTLIVNGSHRKYGNTWRLSRLAHAIALRNESDSEILDLIETPFEFCNGCLECEETGLCVIPDIFTEKFFPKLMKQTNNLYLSGLFQYAHRGDEKFYRSDQLFVRVFY